MTQLPEVHMKTKYWILLLSDVPSITLDVQYRSHPELFAFSKEIYGSSLRDGTIDEKGKVFPDLLPPISTFAESLQRDNGCLPVIFLDHGEPETRSGKSWINESEAQIVRNVIDDLVARNRVRGFLNTCNEFLGYSRTPPGDHLW